MPISALTAPTQLPLTPLQASLARTSPPRALRTADTDAQRLRTTFVTPMRWSPSQVSFSISASEGRNIILRNLIGKVAANLTLRMQTWRPNEELDKTNLQIIDGFADEGHRIGA